MSSVRLLLVLYLLFPMYVGAHQELMKQAQTYFEKGNYIACIQIANQVVEAYPCHAPAYGLIGKSYGRLGQLDQARQRFQKSLACDSLFVDGYYGLGTVALFEGDYNVAEQALSQALQLNPEHIDAMRNLSSLYFDHGEWFLARELCVRGLKIEPDNTDLLTNLAAAYEGMGAYRQSVKWIEKALSQDQSDVHNLIALAGYYLKIGAFEKALPILNQFEENLRANRWKGEALFYTENYAQALPYLKKGLYTDTDGQPTSEPVAKIVRLIADAYYETGQADSSRHYYHKLKQNFSVYHDSLYATHVLHHLQLKQNGGLQVVIPQTSFYYQGSEMTCLQAAVTSVLQYWRDGIHEEELWDGFGVESGSSIIEVLGEIGARYPELEIYNLQWNMDALRSAIQSHYPVLAILSYDNPDFLHAVVVIGFDDQRNLVVINDPLKEKLMKLPQKEFEKQWQLGKREIIFIFPDDRLNKVPPELKAGSEQFRLFLKGYHLLKRGLNEQARSVFEQFRADQLMYSLRISLADVYRMIGKVEAALEILENEAKSDHKDIIPLLSLAQIMIDIEAWQLAKEGALAAIHLSNGKSQRAYLKLAKSYFGERQLKEASAYFEKAAMLYPEGGAYDHLAFFWLGIVQFAQGDTDDSLASFRKSVQAVPSFAPSMIAIERISQLDMSKYQADTIINELISEL